MIALDATALILAVQDAGRPADEANRQKVRAFVESTRRTEGTVFMVPAPVLSEYLVGMGTEEQMDLSRQAIERGFYVAPLDAPAAARAAKIRAKAGGRAFERQMKENHDVSKQNVKVDFQIVAIALEGHATQIIAADEGVLAIAQVAGLPVLRVSDVPTPPPDPPPAQPPKPPPPSLFGNPDE